MSRAIQIQIALTIALLPLSNLGAYEDRGELPTRELSDQFEVRMLVDGRGYDFEFVIYEVAAIVDFEELLISREVNPGEGVMVRKDFIFLSGRFRDRIEVSFRMGGVHEHSERDVVETVSLAFSKRFEAAIRDIQHGRPRVDMNLGVPWGWDDYGWYKMGTVWLRRAILSMQLWMETGPAGAPSQEKSKGDKDGTDDPSHTASVLSIDSLNSFDHRERLENVEIPDELLFELGFCSDFRSETLFEDLSLVRFQFRVRRVHCGTSVWYIFESRPIYDHVRIHIQDGGNQQQETKTALEYFINRFRGIENDLNVGRSRSDIGYRHPPGSIYREAAEVLSELLAGAVDDEAVR